MPVEGGAAETEAAIEAETTRARLVEDSKQRRELAQIFEAPPAR